MKENTMLPLKYQHPRTEFPGRAVRTSKTHPLFVDHVIPENATGRIGLTLCPGKVDPYGAYTNWKRSLSTDMDAIRDWGASVVVTLITDAEIDRLAVRGLSKAVNNRGMDWYHLPIYDGCVPEADFEAEWETIGEDLKERLMNGEDILIHCRGGLGRAGTIASRLLVELGEDPNEAMARIREARQGAIENASQEHYVRTFNDPTADSEPEWEEDPYDEYEMILLEEELERLEDEDGYSFDRKDTFDIWNDTDAWMEDEEIMRQQDLFS